MEVIIPHKPNLMKQETPPKMRKNAKNLPAEMLGDQKRRSSSRSIKRKRFDDEIVEYSLSLTQSRNEQHRLGRPRAQAHLPLSTSPIIAKPPLVLNPPNTFEPSPKKPLLETTTVTAPVTPTITASTVNVQELPSPIIGKTPMSAPHTTTATRRGPRATRRARRTGRPPNQLTTKDLGRWKPIDDLALIVGVQQTNDLRVVHRGVKFSCKFTMQEIQTRWYALLYETTISRTAVIAMRNLHPEVADMVFARALYSVHEEDLLGTIKSNDNPKLEQFQELLEKNAKIFFPARTAKGLQIHWQLMKKYQLLPDQNIRLASGAEQPMQFADAEELIVDGELNDPRNEALEIELSIADRKKKRYIRLLESELSRWNVLVDSIAVVGIPPEFDNQTLAILRGSLVRYLMRSKEITFGREGKDFIVDVDFSLEGPVSKISRRQGTIKLRSNGDFFIANEGKRPIFIDGVPLIHGNKSRLSNNCVLEVGELRFVFLVNYELINAIRHESAKTTSQLN